MIETSELYVPEGIIGTVPLLVAFHGGGRDGASQIALWKSLADRQRFIILAPNSATQWWFAPEDHQNIANKANHAIATLPVDRSRVYLFGHSLGATMALFEGFLNRKLIAALALHSPTARGGIYQLPQEPGTRRLPVGVWVGEVQSDSNWHTASAMEQAYKEHPNVAIQLRVLPHHQHNDIYNRPGLTDEVWAFLSQYTL